MTAARLLRHFFAALAVAGSLSAVSAPPPAAGTSRAATPQLAILDTDIGDDIDDAFALALALRSPELRLLGITTAYGDTHLRARLVDRFLHAAGVENLPVAAGVPSASATAFTQAAYAGQAPDRKPPDAVAFLLDRIRAHPNQITLIAIGPLTNLRAALERDPATFRRLRRVVVMGGSIHQGYDDPKTGAPTPPEPEWNFSRDPAAAQALLASGVPVFLLPLDATQIRFPAAARETLLAQGSPLAEQLALLYHQWLAGSPWHRPDPVLFDPVAVASAFRPSLCPAVPLRLEIDGKGFSRPVEGPPNAEVCLHSDAAAFLALFNQRLLSPGPR